MTYLNACFCAVSRCAVPWRQQQLRRVPACPLKCQATALTAQPSAVPVSALSFIRYEHQSRLHCTAKAVYGRAHADAMFLAGGEGSAEVSSRPAAANATKVRRTGSPESSSSPRREAQQQTATGSPCSSPAASPTASARRKQEATAAAAPDTDGKLSAAAADDPGHIESPKAAALPRVESAADYVLAHSSEADAVAINGGGSGEDTDRNGDGAASPPTAQLQGDGGAPDRQHRGSTTAAEESQRDDSASGDRQQRGSMEERMPSARAAPDDIQGELQARFAQITATGAILCGWSEAQFSVFFQTIANGRESRGSALAGPP